MYAIIIENLAAPLTLESIATRLGMSEGHLRSSFRKDTGMSLGYFQRMLRLQYAASLLGNGSNVIEAAARCGWESVFSFSRAFRSHWGTAPKHFLPCR